MEDPVELGSELPAGKTELNARNRIRVMFVSENSSYVLLTLPEE